MMETLALYDDLRIRKEGFDLEMMAASLSGEAMPPRPIVTGAAPPVSDVV